MQGICINTGSTTVLREGQKYYLFDHGPNYYVSNFDNVNAHMGSYRKDHFKLLQQEPEKEPEQPTIRLKRFVAKVAKHRNGYRIGDLFIISEKGPNGYYHVYLKDMPAKGPVGSYITNFFEIITDYDELIKPMAGKTPERPKLEAQPKTAAIPLPIPEKAEEKAAAQPSKAKKQKATKEPEGQLNIFDFLEG